MHAVSILNLMIWATVEMIEVEVGWNLETTKKATVKPSYGSLFPQKLGLNGQGLVLLYT